MDFKLLKNYYTIGRNIRNPLQSITGTKTIDEMICSCR